MQALTKVGCMRSALSYRAHAVLTMCIASLAVQADSAAMTHHTAYWHAMCNGTGRHPA